MSVQADWIAALLTAGIVGVYELWFALAQRRRPLKLARTAHTELRQEWFDAVSRQPGSEILTVQTLRNALMSASMMASTTALGLMGAVTLFTASTRDSLNAAPQLSALLTPRLVVELIILTLLFGALVSSTMSVRYYNHAGFIGGMPVGSEARSRWHEVGRAHVRRAGILYSWSLRNLVLVIPALAFLLFPMAGPLLAAAVTGVLWAIDQVNAPGPDRIQASQAEPSQNTSSHDAPSQASETKNAP